MKLAAVLSTALLCHCLVTVAASPAAKAKATKTVLIQDGEDPDPIVQVKRGVIKTMLKDAWDSYVQFAWGENELKPVSQAGQTGGIYGDSKIGATIIDALDTLYIMGLNDEFKAGRDWVAANLDFSTVNASVSVFETNIRIVGGFLTAFALTGDQLFVDKAVEIADLLLPAFDSPTGIPYSHINLKTGEVRRGGQSCLAEFGTLHLEFVYLSEVTGNPIYKEKVDKVRQVLKDAEKENGLYGNYMSPESGKFVSDHVSIGAMGDSFYEYLIKAAIQLNDQEARQMYDEAMNAFVDNGLVKVSKQSHLLYIAEKNAGSIQNVVGHLACFAGGMFALGAHVDPQNLSGNRDRDAEIGQNFTNTCHESYIRTQTKIGPEAFVFTDDTEAEGTNSKGYILRPEVIESYFVLYRLTGDNKYRDWGWEAAQAIQRYCKAGGVGSHGGYSGLRNVDVENPQQDDVQQTFFLAETLKYLYLLFSSNDLISLDEWVFNTECHPLPIKATNPLF